MGNLTATGAQDRARAPWLGLVITVTLVQAMLALGTRTLPLFGAPLTAASGIRPDAVGQLASATSFGSMIFFLWGSAALGRLSSLRQLQLGCAFTGIALAAVLWLSSSWPMLLIAAFAIGLGYGPSAPAGSDLLMRTAPVERRGMIFSIKQAGVPLGGLAAGLILPPIVISAGWLGAAFLTAAGLAFATVLALFFFRQSMDTAGVTQRERLPAGVRIRRLAMAPVRMFALLLNARELRLLTAAGVALGVAQGVVFGYFPVFLNDHVGLGLVASGAAFALLQGLGIFGRILLGWLSDRIGSPIRTMIWLCFASGVTTMSLSILEPTSHWLLIAGLSALAGVTVISWNGVFLTGLAEVAPEGRVGEITAAGTFVLFAGYVICPLIMQWVFRLGDGYAAGLILSGLVPILMGVALWRGTRRPG